jgi:O-antigen ligase/tetratricopeptide (TPR) repeat protein
MYICLGLVPFVAYYIADGGTFDMLNFGSSGMFFPFISGKNIAFRGLVEIAFACWALLALLDPKYRPKKSPILVAYTLFIVAIFISDMFGVDPWRSFWSNFERMEGFIGHIHLFVYFVILSSVVSTAKEWRTMLQVFLASNVLVMSFGFSQLFGTKEFILAKVFPQLAAKFAASFPVHMSSTRIDSTIGNSAYYGVYCLFFAFIAAIFWTEAKQKWEKWVYGILVALNLISVFYSGTRGSMVGLVAAIFVSFSLIAWKEKGKARKVLIGSLVAIVVLVGSIFMMKNSSLVQNSPSLSRIASIAPGDLTTMSRFTIWTISYEAWKDRPIFGYGQENFSNIFAERFIPEKMWNLEPWYDRSHDVFFDWLVAGGIVGLATYLSIFGAAFYVMWRKKTELEHEFPLRERALLSGLFIGYFIHNIFVFDNLTSYILFIAVISYIVAKTSGGKHYFGAEKVNEESVTWLWAPIVGVLFLVIFYSVSYKTYVTNRYLISGMDVQRHIAQGESFAQVLEIQKKAFRAAIDMNVAGSEEAREQFLQVSARMTQVQIPPSVGAADRQQIAQSLNALIEEARNEITNSYPRYKDDVRALSIFGMFYNGINDPASAEKVLSEAIAISPYKQITAFDLVRAYLAQKKYDEGYQLAKKVFLAAPDYDVAMKLYVVCAIYNGKFSEVVGVLAPLGKTVPVDGDILGALVEARQYDTAIALLNDLKKSQPGLSAQIDDYISKVVARRNGK